MVTIAEIDGPHRTARADVARLALQLRAAKRAADQAAVVHAAAGDLTGSAHEALLRTLHERVEQRRREQVEELAEARAAAADLVDAARADAATLVAAASAGAAEFVSGVVPASPVVVPSRSTAVAAASVVAPHAGWAAPGQSGPGWTPPVPAVTTATSADPRPVAARGWRGFWHDVAYADVVLPLVAVLLVLVVLLAWLA